jgi:hypothetical protein
VLSTCCLCPSVGSGARADFKKNYKKNNSKEISRVQPSASSLVRLIAAAAGRMHLTNLGLSLRPDSLCGRRARCLGVLEAGRLRVASATAPTAKSEGVAGR